MSRRILILIAVLAVPLSLIAGPAVQAALAQGVSSAVVTPASGPPGSTVNASGANWTPGDNIQAEWGDDYSNLGSPVVVASEGTFTDSFAIPSDATPGSHQVLFWDEQAQYFVVANFDVTGVSSPPPPSSCSVPSVSFTPSSGPVGTTFTIAGSNWVPGGTVTSTIPYGSPGWFTGYQTPTVDVNGGFSYTETVSTGPGGPTPPGTYVFTYVEKYGGCSLSVSQTFTVTGGAACVFSAPSGAFGLVGHVGWGFELAGGNWEFGANEGPYYWPLHKADISKTWDQTGSFSHMITTFTNGGPYNGPGYYTSYKCQAVPMPDAASAAAEVSHEWHEYYAIPGQDCLAQVYNVLTDYGATGLPNDIFDPIPNAWYSQLSGFSAPVSL